MTTSEGAVHSSQFWVGHGHRSQWVGLAFKTNVVNINGYRMNKVLDSYLMAGLQ